MSASEGIITSKGLRPAVANIEQEQRPKFVATLRGQIRIEGDVRCNAFVESLHDENPDFVVGRPLAALAEASRRQDEGGGAG